MERGRSIVADAIHSRSYGRRSSRCWPRSLAKMTVADICRRADINRGTFYLHYEDKFAPARRAYRRGLGGGAARSGNGGGCPLPASAGKR